jgi:magnesium-transporting ATPase (P-type)
MRIAERIRSAIIESMTALKDKIKLALDESRMLILGAQILLGFDLRAAFEPAFERLPRSSQLLKMVTLVVLLGAIALIMAPGSYHRIVRGGSDAEDVHQFATTVMDIALVPILVTFALDVYLSTGRIVGMTGGIVGGASVGVVGFFFWYGLGLLSASKREKRSGNEKKRKPRAHPTDLKTKIDQALTEARVVLPGAQALLGFQLVTIFMDGFDKLPNSSKYVHMISLGWMALTIILLMSPAAYHRIAERGEDTVRMHKFASVLLLAAMITLPIGICGDVYVVLYKVTSSLPASIGIAIAVLAFFYGIWFGFTTYRRAKLVEDDSE